MSEGLRRDYQLLEEIGRGRFGKVFRCFRPETGEFFACKSIDKRAITDPVDRECLEKEVKFHRLAGGHPNVVQVHAVYEDEESLHLVMELCQSPDLFDRVSKRVFTEPEAAALMAQLMEAIAHCHRLGVAHRDIKPDNVLFDDRDRLKLADFGSADCFREGEGLREIVGTPYYVAPEVLRSKEYNEKVDVWSAGVILYVLLSGIPPFYGESPAEIFESVLRANLRFPSRSFHSVSPAAKDLMRKMLCKEVSRRFSAEQVLRHPWIRSGGEQSSASYLT
ncbi:phosphoenolpyruvate carboxylase kinase 1-like [Nymphaea colorata]|uniref:phosphoenolpyruvate carboxylase kinase 1-like n=1 Tax=Nymphaea colorata TaxID=210225 RepID=UPI00129E86ED|nr:phosphoenolpyruvate carboxylase kinase 1-like [Nymphaea colorata]